MASSSATEDGSEGVAVSIHCHCVGNMHCGTTGLAVLCNRGQGLSTECGSVFVRTVWAAYGSFGSAGSSTSPRVKTYHQMAQKKANQSLNQKLVFLTENAKMSVLGRTNCKTDFGPERTCKPMLTSAANCKIRTHSDQTGCLLLSILQGIGTATAPAPHRQHTRSRTS